MKAGRKVLSSLGRGISGGGVITMWRRAGTQRRQLIGQENETGVCAGANGTEWESGWG